MKIRSDCAAWGVRVARSAWEISRNYGSQSLENTLKGVHCTMRRVCFRKIFTRRCDPPARQTQFHLPSQPRCHAVYLQGGAFVSGFGLVRAVFYTTIVQFSDMTADLLAPSFFPYPAPSLKCRLTSSDDIILAYEKEGGLMALMILILDRKEDLQERDLPDNFHIKFRNM